MAESSRPLSPHLQIYRWQIQMVTSILHRATGIVLAVGTLLMVWGLMALADGPEAFATFQQAARHPLGILVLIGWSWAFCYHLCNGIRHLVQDTGAGYAVPQLVRSSWASVIGSLVLTGALWGWVLFTGVLA